MRIAICDDFAVYREQVSYIVKEYFAGKDQSISLTVYEDGKELINDARKIGGYDIYILDVLMPELSGIELGITLRQMGLSGQIIYLTSSEEYAIDAFKAKAFNYILKPIDKMELYSTLDEVISIISTQVQKSVIMKTKEGDIRLTINNILYVDMNKRMVVYHLTDGRSVESSTIRTTFAEAIQELLHDDRFVLCGASTAVNLHYITMVEKDSLLFHDGSQLYIGVRACRQLRTIWNDFWNNHKE